MRIAPMGSETGAYVGMVIGYWEQACALLNYGLLRSEEHTSELQSQSNLVCRLLLEKKKKNNIYYMHKPFNDPKLLDFVQQTLVRNRDQPTKRAKRECLQIRLDTLNLH